MKIALVVVGLVIVLMVIVLVGGAVQGFRALRRWLRGEAQP